MPRLTVWMVRTALLHFGLGFTVGALMLWNKGQPFEPTLWRWLFPHVEIMLIGWTIQFAMGVAFWILPRFPNPPKYGQVHLGWWTYGLLNGGVLCVVLSSLVNGAAWLALAGRLLELAGMVCFAVLIWPRVKPFAEGLKQT